MMGVVLFTCQGKKPSRVKLRYMTWDSARGLEPERRIIEAFEANHPHIQVKLEPNPQRYEDKILTSMAGGTPPDVFLWWNFPKLVKFGGLVDLTPYLERNPDLSATNYYRNILRYTSIDGKIYGLPKDFTPRVIFYNKALFDEAKIPYPTEDWTWDDFLQIARKLTKGDQYGFCAVPSTYNLQSWVWSNGGDFISPDGTKARGYLDSPQTIEAVKFYADLYLKYKVSPSPSIRASMGGATEMFLTGKLGMMDNGRWPLIRLKKTDLRVGTLLPPHPQGKNLVTVLHASGQVMSSRCKNKEEAWELLKAMSDSFAQRRRAEAGWAIPAMPELVNELGFAKDPLERAFIRAISYATVTPCFMRTADWEEVYDRPISQALERIFLLKADVEETLIETARKIDEKAALKKR